MEQQPSSPALSIGQSLDKAWGDMKQNILLFAAFTLLYYIVTTVVGLIPLVGFVTSLFGFILPASIFNAYRTIRQKGKLDFNDFLSWSPRFGRMFVGYLLQIVILAVLVVPFVFLVISVTGFNFFTFKPHTTEDVREVMGLFAGAAFVLIFLGTLVVGAILGIVLFGYTYLLQFTEHSYTDCLKMSWNIGKKNAGSIIVFFLLSIALSMLGTLACCVGLLVTIPLVMGIQYYFLDSMFPQEDKMQQWDFMQQMPPAPGNQ